MNGVADPRTVRARVDAALAGDVDEAMEREGRTESDIIRRALYTYLHGKPVVTWQPTTSSGTAATGSLSSGGKVFKGSDPKGTK